MSNMTGIFVRELKNRFLCEVLIDGIPQECYIASSCHLGNFIELSGKEVTLRRIKSPKARTKFAVCGFNLEETEIPLDMSVSNRVIEKEIHRRLMCFLGKRKDVIKEHIVDGYKSDLYIRDTNTIIEIKSVLTIEKHALFPTVYSERSVKQLHKLSDLLDRGYNVFYFLVSLNPRVRDICLNDDSSEFMEAFCNCVSKGMRCHGFSIKTIDGCPTIYKRIPILIEEAL